MARKVISKKRNNDMDMRAPVHTTAAEPIVETQTYSAPSTASVPTPTMRSRSRVRPSFIFLCVVTLGMLFTAGYLYTQLKTLRQDSQTATAEKTEETLQRVGKLIDLPQGETPALITITDTADLKQQAFFKNVKKGHIVLFYAVARKAYLYDPEANIIVEVATLAAEDTSE